MENKKTYYVEECRGCALHVSSTPCTPSTFNQDTSKCPCNICLIKGMCAIPCGDLKLFMSNFSQHSQRKGNK